MKLARNKLIEDINTIPEILYNLSERILDLYNMFQGDEENGDIMDRLKEIELQMGDIMAAQQRQENLMNLIVHLLSKKGKA